MSAIVTRYIGPTNARASHIKAVCSDGSLTVAWDHSLTHETNHRAAAERLAHKLGWVGEWVGARMPSDSGSVFVCVGPFGSGFVIKEETQAE